MLLSKAIAIVLLAIFSVILLILGYLAAFYFTKDKDFRYWEVVALLMYISGTVSTFVAWYLI